MAAPKVRNEKIKEAQELLAQLESVDAKGLARTEELTREINFEDAVPHFEKMLDVVKQLHQRQINRLPLQHVEGIINSCKLLLANIAKVKDFDINQNTPANVCKAIVQDVKNSYDDFVEPLVLPLAFTATQATDYSKIEREAKGYRATIEEEYLKFKKLLEQQREEAEAALQAVKEQAAEAGVSSNAHIFKSASDSYADLSKCWMWATIVSSVITLSVAVGYVVMSFYVNIDTTPKVIQYTVSKVILLSTLSFGVFWCARNYKSCLHNKVLNEHRANALMTFRAFVEGSGDQQVKEAILLQACQAAFVNRPTGYESQEKEAQTINPVVEILGKAAMKSEPT
ncbi:hypothetical protein [Paucidesulfovibrio longus]|uniref:hypothetical protein n=1 Tax=Paucidesulfovibrio longus TaxID=889 RepID=UPI0012DE1209|nr:hypothetical protein [Paucidesulfovibrio longus]